MVARRGIPGVAVAASALIRALSLALVLALPAGTACADGAGDEKKWTEEIEILDALVDVLADEGRYGEALQALMTSREQITAAYGPAHPAPALVSNIMARYFLRLNSRMSARLHAETSVQQMELALGRNSLRLVPLLQDLSSAYERLGEWAAARKTIDRARAIVEAAAPNTGRNALVLRESARIALAAGEADLGPSLLDLQRALPIITAVFGPDDIEVAITLEVAANIAWRVAMLQPDRESRRQVLARATAALTRALEIRRKKSGDNHPGLIGPLHRLAIIARDEGAFAQAERFFMRALTLLEKQQFGTMGPEGANVLRDAMIMTAQRNQNPLALSMCSFLLQRDAAFLANERVLPVSLREVNG